MLDKQTVAMFPWQPPPPSQVASFAFILSTYILNWLGPIILPTLQLAASQVLFPLRVAVIIIERTNHAFIEIKSCSLGISNFDNRTAPRPHTKAKYVVILSMKLALDVSFLSH